MKNFLLNLLILIITLAILFLLLEVGVRFFVKQSDEFFEKNEKTGILHIPGKEGYWRSQEFDNKISINSHGFNDREYSLDKASGTIRYVFLGDSVTEALQVNRDKNFVNLFEDKLNKNTGGQNYEVINLGVSTFGTGREYLVLKHYGLRYQPDRVYLVFFLGNDVNNNFLEDLEHPLFVDSETVTLFSKFKTFLLSHSRTMKFVKDRCYQSKPIRMVLEKIHIFSVGNNNKQGVLNSAKDYEVFISDGNETIELGWKKTFEYINLIKNLCDENGLELKVIMIPDRIQIYADWFEELRRNYPELNASNFDLGLPNARLTSNLELSDIDFIDCTPMVRQLSEESDERLYFKYDGHLTEAGHEVILKCLQNINN